VRGCSLETRERFPLTYGAFEHHVHSLSRSLDEAALCQRFGQASVATILLVQNVLGRDARWDASGAYDLESAGELAHEH
jgi:hypothetical protein